MGLSEAGHLYNPAPRSSHLLRSKCNSVFASAACWACDGSDDDEQPPSANSPSTAIAKNTRFVICSALPPEFRFAIQLSPISVGTCVDDTSRELLASTFDRRLRFRHLFRHLSFHRVKVETRTPLHRRVLEEGLEFLAHHLLNEHEAPELELEPVEVLLRAILRSIVGPASPLERIQAKVGDVRHVRMGLITQPSIGLVNETILIVVDAHRTDCAFAEVEDFVTVGRPFAGDR